MRATEFIVEYKQYPTREYEGVTFTMVERDGQLIVKPLNDYGISMGHVVFNMDGKLLDPQDLVIADKYQGQGIARVMYDYIKSQGFTIERSWDQTPAGAGFWNKHRGEDVRVWEGMFDVFKSEPKMKINLQELSDGVYVTVTLGREELARFDFEQLGDNDLIADDMSVSPAYRGRGIAKMVYDHMKKLGYNVHRSEYQTDAGKHFWDKNKGAGSKVWENFADGKNPGRKGLSKRMGVDTKASVSTLRNVAKHSTGEKQRMAHWLANMKAGRAKK